MNRYVLRTVLVWRTQSPDRKVRVRAASMNSACVAAAPVLGISRGVNGLTSTVDHSAPQEVILAPKMPQAQIWNRRIVMTEAPWTDENRLKIIAKLSKAIASECQQSAHPALRRIFDLATTTN